MLPLYLLAAHLLGDFVFQTRWQAAGKLADGRLGGLRTRHVVAYCLPFVPVAVYAAPDGWRAAQFMLGLYGLHVLTDSRRFYSTLGDVIAWRFSSQRNITISGGDVFEVGDRIKIGGKPLDPTGIVVRTFGGYTRVRLDLEANPWTPIPLMIDQALHVCQLALLGGLFLT